VNDELAITAAIFVAITVKQKIKENKQKRMWTYYLIPKALINLFLAGEEK